MFAHTARQRLARDELRDGGGDDVRVAEERPVDCRDGGEDILFPPPSRRTFGAYVPLLSLPERVPRGVTSTWDLRGSASLLPISPDFLSIPLVSIVRLSFPLNDREFFDGRVITRCSRYEVVLDRTSLDSRAGTSRPFL